MKMTSNSFDHNGVRNFVFRQENDFQSLSKSTRPRGRRIDEKACVFKFGLEMELPCLVVLGAIVVLGHVVGSNGCFPEEKRALLDFKASYANETLLPSWLNYTDSNCCEWQGVSCLTSSSRVTGLSLWNFTRNWHSDFENHCYQYHRLNWSLFLPFKELRTLILSANCFDGFIQKEGTL
ncbi:hypothetical protein RJT34_29312 [Clitoria ternatea]|uniref:Leucine-rich repeat-containing N-terminal plant-type domain-containing protein n=1 Tax=Clitoria ternatea TaxID=43366 RepID=A0AAN9IC14_CLITE